MPGSKAMFSGSSMFARFNRSPKAPEKKSVQMHEFSKPAESNRLPGLKNGYQLGRPALMKKSGKYRVSYKGLNNSKRVPYMKDLYQTLIDLKWRWALMIFCSTFFVIYFVFAILWYILSLAHGDFSNIDNPKWTPCVENMKTFGDALLFSIETQTTIGYGTLYPNTNCGGSVPLVYLQVTLGFLLETILMGFILVKVARPKHRRHTLLFSDSVCVCIEDGQLCLQVRIGDMRQSHLVDNHAYGIFISERISPEGIVYPLYQQQLHFEAHEMDDRVFMIWPMILKHRINESSPLWNMDFDEVLAHTFEIIVIMEGTIEATGELCQARTSFTSKDIQWGFRFSNMVDFDGQSGYWEANFKAFNSVVPTPTPKCSGKDVAALYRGTGTFQTPEGQSSFRRAMSQDAALNIIKEEKLSSLK